MLRRSRIRSKRKPDPDRRKRDLARRSFRASLAELRGDTPPPSGVSPRAVAELANCGLEIDQGGLLRSPGGPPLAAVRVGRVRPVSIPIVKAVRLKSPAWLELVRALPCAVCGRKPPSEAHHWPHRSAGGSDLETIPLCRSCHRKATANALSADQDLLVAATLHRLLRSVRTGTIDARVLLAMAVEVVLSR